MIKMSLIFEGNEADSNRLDMYDAAQAMMGFQRSLALTTHLVLNGTVITQAPALKGAQILSAPPEAGSWKTEAFILGALLTAGTAPQNSVVGHLMYSGYDYVISQSLGFHVDYEKTLQAPYAELKKNRDNDLPIIEQSQFNSVIEKCEYSIKEMHRPIVKSGTAQRATILFRTDKVQMPLNNPLSEVTFNNMRSSSEDEEPVMVRGKVSSYNLNTYKGRVFVPEEGRPISFNLAYGEEFSLSVAKITSSLQANAKDRSSDSSTVVLRAYKTFTRSGLLKSLLVVEVM